MSSWHRRNTDNFFCDAYLSLFFSFSCKDDYKTVFRSDMKLKILDTIVPIFSTILGFAIIIFLIGSAFQGNGDPEFITFGRGVSRFGALVVFFDLLYLGLSLHGSYRLIKSKVYSFHLAVKRDGICFVQDCHMKCCSIVAALHIFDCCIFKSKKSQTVSQLCMCTFTLFFVMILQHIIHIGLPLPLDSFRSNHWADCHRSCGGCTSLLLLLLSLQLFNVSFLQSRNRHIL